MHHVVLERWSRGSSPLHKADARAKIAVLVVFLVVLATARQALAGVGGGLAIFLLAGLLAARLPVRGALSRAAVVLPFSIAFALICWLGGDPTRGIHLLAKSYLSALAALLLVGTTPLPALLRGMESLGAPRFLLMVAQFLYRYLFVISEEAQHMSKAAVSRGGARFRAAAGAVAVLFVRSYSRASEIHRAMLARGFEGHIQNLGTAKFGWSDAAFVLAASLGLVALRVAAERWS